MGKICCYTSISFSYLAKARVLALSFKRFHPDWEFIVCITDKEPEGFKFNIDEEPFDSVLWEDRLGIPDNKSWLFKHNVVEICTAVKGPILYRLTKSDAEYLIYLDPDIAVFGSLDPIIEWLHEYEILLTPHQLDPDKDKNAVIDNEICSLKHGIYNLGFVAVKNQGEGKRFAKWWSDRLTEFCYDDIPNGLFTDQRWCDLVPVFFDKVKVIKDPGYNVASWNLSQRNIEIDITGRITVNGYLLRFFHFTKLGPIANIMTQRYARDNIEVYELWAWYKKMVEDNSEHLIPNRWWYYANFTNGDSILDSHRKIYKERVDLQNAFKDPFDSDGTSFHEWLTVNDFM